VDIAFPGKKAGKPRNQDGADYHVLDEKTKV
jgi:hypothetical protein